jgi:hypothetical protein
MAPCLPRPVPPAGLGLVASLTIGLVSEEFVVTHKQKKLSETARALLTAASAHYSHLIQPPRLPAAAARQIVRSLLNTGLAEEVPALIDDQGYVWRQGDDGSDRMQRVVTLWPGLIREAEDSVAAEQTR